MAEMILNRLAMSNFKGVKSLELRFAQDRTDISGRNATGKTTIVDAFCWLLWNKDSNDNAPGSDAFHEKPLDADGHEVHYVDTEVEMDCTLDGKPFNLKRLQREHWEKKRGFVDEVYKGNESTYWINGIETKVTEFKSRIADIVAPDVFKLIGKLGAFNALKWQDRRAVLLGLSGTDIDNVLLEQPGYKTLKAELEATHYTVDELRANLNDRRKLANDVLKMIPVRIDEVKKSIIEMTPEQVQDERYIADEADRDIENVMAQIVALQNGSDYEAKRQRIALLEGQSAMIQRGMQADLLRQREAAQLKVKNERDILERLKIYSGEAAVKAAKAGKDLSEAIAERDKLRKDFADAKAMSTVVNEVCPTCGRPLEPEQIESAKAALEAKRKSLMDDIRVKGKAAAGEVEEFSKASEQAGAEVAEAALKIQEQQKAYDAAVIAAGEIPAKPDYASNQELQSIQQEIDKLYTDSQADTGSKVEGLKSRIEDIKKTKARAEARIAAFNASESLKARITELEEQRKSEGVNLASAEKLLDLTEKFIRDRCASLEQSINSKFDNVRWKLFNVQINGGLADCCVCMIPCAAGLVSYECANTASQINADIEIVRNLSQFYNVKLPLFVDNAERLNSIADAGTQMITLSVSTDDLKVEER